MQSLRLKDLAREMSRVTDGDALSETTAYLEPSSVRNNYCSSQRHSQNQICNNNLIRRFVDAYKSVQVGVVVLNVLTVHLIYLQRIIEFCLLL